ncbi:MAG: hypothetical protein ACFFBD_21585 [Candidatus Hodarchaeota archaeon]
MISDFHQVVDLAIPTHVGLNLMSSGYPFCVRWREAKTSREYDLRRVNACPMPVHSDLLKVARVVLRGQRGSNATELLDNNAV